MRPYELQQTMMIIFALLFVCSFNKIRNDVVFETKSNFFVGAFILALTMLSVYFTLIFIALLGFTILLVTVFKKDYNIFVYYVFMFITSIIFAKLLYFSFGSGLIDYRGQEALSNFQTSNIFLNLRVTFKNVFFIFHKNNFFLILILIFSIFQFGLVFVKNIKTVLISKKMVLFLVCLLYYGLTLFFAPIDMKDLRYVASVYPLFSVLFLFKSVDKWSIGVPVFVLILSILSVLPLSINNSIEHIDDIHVDEIYSVKDSDIPIVVRGDVMWTLGCFIPYLGDDQVCYVVKNFVDISDLNLNKFWYYAQDGIDIDFYDNTYALKKKNDIYMAVEYLFHKR